MDLHDVWKRELPIGMTSRAGARPCFVVLHDCSTGHGKLARPICLAASGV